MALPIAVARKIAIASSEPRLLEAVDTRKEVGPYFGFAALSVPDIRPVSNHVTEFDSAHLLALWVCYRNWQSLGRVMAQYEPVAKMCFADSEPG